ncbi:hypothetical protein PVL29_003741 [Vitis rotundifolia]|uniref:Uncharacterized protein n=1 Tax=Vitis rotundifolia TaxID=103349 RepID=A0AA39ADT6_VITRO|nr:hypothetical protein PVL29_003741 [Vitis rotundifolia]
MEEKGVFGIEAEGLPQFEGTSEVRGCLARYGAVKANKLNRPRDELGEIVTEIRKDVHTQYLTYPSPSPLLSSSLLSNLPHLTNIFHYPVT